jgi:hypothetical protein
MLLAPAPTPCDGRVEEGWVALSDERTPDGWGQRNDTASYRVEGGAIVGRTSDGSPNSFLVTAQAYGGFELEVRGDDALNFGIEIRSRTGPVF